MPSIFTKIINREIPAYIVAEDEHFIAFLDVFPVAHGHVLVVPKKEVDYIFDLDDETYAGLMQFARKVAAGLEKAFPCERIGLAVVGLEVPHVHVHLIPLNTMEDITFTKEKLKLEKSTFASYQERITQALS